MTRALVVLSLSLLGCNAGLGVAQTAKTVDPSAGRMSTGFSAAFNEYSEHHKGIGANYWFEPGFRVGAAKKTDIGFGPWLGLGLQFDVKHELTPREKPYGFALRAGGGVSTGALTSYSVLVGAIASYALVDWFTPYASAGFRNFWFYNQERKPDPPLGSTWASRAGYGDGLAQLTVGLRLGHPSGAVYVEYSRYQPLQNDPGDFFKLVATNIISVTVGFCITRNCTYG